MVLVSTYHTFDDHYHPLACPRSQHVNRCVWANICMPVPRGAEVGLDGVGFTQDNLTKRRQSSTLRSHRLVYFVAKVMSKCMENKHFPPYTYVALQSLQHCVRMNQPINSHLYLTASN